MRTPSAWPAQPADADDPVEEILRRDPAGAYAASDAATRSWYRYTLEVWHARTGLAVSDVAGRVLARANEAARALGPEAPAAHVGYHLIGAGARALAAELSLRLTIIERARQAVADRPATAYAVLLAGLVAASMAAAWAAGGLGALPWPWRLLLLAVVLPVMVRSVALLVRAGLARLAPASPLPRLDPGSTAVRELRVFVVVPAVASTPERARELVARLAHMATLEPDPLLRFALLADFADAPTARLPSDDAVIAAEREVVTRVNADLRDAMGDRVFVLHRRRRWSASQQAWIGWERKRGKLLEFGRLLDGADNPTTFAWVLGDLADILTKARFQYVLTLDEGTWLDRGQACELARVAAHPLNRPVVDVCAGRLSHGYAIFQPAIVQTYEAEAPWRARSLGSSQAFAPGTAVAHSTFRALGAGVYQGRGLYDVQAFRRLLDGRFPDGTVLHHDLLEGFAAATAEVPEAYLVQPWPPSYLTQLQRGHRWLRGYAQALPWVLLRRLRDARGTCRDNPLRPIHRLLLCEIVLAELQKPASLLMLLAAWTVLPRGAELWAVIACPAVVVFLVACVRESLRAASTRAPRPGRRQALLVRALAAGFQVSLLAFEAIFVLDALVRALWRLVVSRRRLLDWTTGYAAAAAAPRSQRDYWRALWPATLVGVVALVAVGATRPERLPLAGPVVLGWLCSPWLVRLLDGGGLASPWGKTGARCSSSLM